MSQHYSHKGRGHRTVESIALCMAAGCLCTCTSSEQALPHPGSPDPFTHTRVQTPWESAMRGFLFGRFGAFGNR